MCLPIGEIATAIWWALSTPNYYNWIQALCQKGWGGMFRAVYKTYEGWGVWITFKLTQDDNLAWTIYKERQEHQPELPVFWEAQNFFDMLMRDFICPGFMLF